MFASGPQGFDTVIGEPPTLQLSGPACGGPSVCADGSSTVAVTAPGPVPLSFELTPLVDAGVMLEAGSLRTALTPLFDFAHPGLDDQPMSIDLRIDVGEPSPAPSGDTTPTITPAAPVTTVGGGFQLLTFPFAAVADDVEQLEAILAPSAEPVDAAALGVDWSTHAAVVLTIPTDGCPPLLAGLEIIDRRAEPVFVTAGYRSCIEPLLSHTVIAAVERSPARRRRRGRPPGRSPVLRHRGRRRGRHRPGRAADDRRRRRQRRTSATSPGQPSCRPPARSPSPRWRTAHRSTSSATTTARSARSTRALPPRGRRHRAAPPRRVDGRDPDLPRRRRVGRVRPAPRRVPDHGPADLRHPRRRGRGGDRLTGRPTARVAGDLDLRPARHGQRQDPPGRADQPRRGTRAPDRRHRARSTPR